MITYPWYCIINGNNPLIQGDLLNSCPIIIPEVGIDSDEVDANIQEYDVIIMSQSCDLENKKIDIVLVCPVHSLIKAGEVNNFFRSTKGKNELRKGNVIGYHLLNRCDLQGFERDFMVVDFHNVFGVPFNFLNKLAQDAGNRISLLSPYREHLSQAFGRFFMRIGLPVGIPEFKSKK